MNKVVGIISCLTDDNRQDKVNSVIKTILTIKKYLKLPVIVIASDWSVKDVSHLKQNDIKDITLYTFSKYSYASAHEALRKIFLNKTKYDWLILCNDNMDLVCDDEGGKKYLEEIDEHNDGVIKFFANSQTLQAFSRSSLENRPYTGLLDTPTNLGGDMCEILWNSTFKKDMPDSVYRFSKYHIMDRNSLIKLYLSNSSTLCQEALNLNKVYNGPIDIVIPWVNPDDVSWQEQYKKYKKLEQSDDVKDEDFNGPCRFRDMGTINYVFRSIEKNCPGVNKVFLILSNESQIPSWLNTKCDKLEIVYHDEYIPKELLPTFNSNVIENFLYRLDKLSDNYILCNDDTLFMNKLSPDMFFMYNKPVLSGNYKKLGKFSNDNLYWMMLNNNMVLEEKYAEVTNTKDFRFDHMHLMVPHQRSFEKLIWLENYDYLYNALAASKFRSNKNITHLLFNDLCEMFGHCIYKPLLYINSMCVNMTDDFNVSCLDNCDLACYNDTSRLEDYDGLKDRLLAHFEDIFPEKSKFEV